MSFGNIISLISVIVMVARLIFDYNQARKSSKIEKR